MNLELSGQNVLITGASRGIGFAVAQAFAREGCHLHMAARTAADLETARAKILSECKVNITCHALDLGISANIMSLTGVVIAFSELIDASIVVVEQTHKKLEIWEREGRRRDVRDVVLEGVKEVCGPTFFALLVMAIS